MKKVMGVFLLVFLCAPLSLALPRDIEQEFLPIVWKSGKYEIIDCEGNQADQEWLIETFGDVTVQPGSGAKLTELSCDVSGISVFRVYAEPGTIVIRHWPGAPPLPKELVGWYDKGVHGVTNKDGYIDFAMGFGDYYFPPDGGPECVWIHPNGDLLCGIGMLGGTPHTHLNSEWRIK